MAVIRGTSRGAPRNGLYAIRSTVTLMIPQPTMAIPRTASTAGQMCVAESPAWRPNRSDRQRHRDHPAEHEDVAVGEVDQLEDAVDERVAERDQRVDRAARDPDQKCLEEVRRRLLEVDRQPDDEQRDEREAEDGTGSIPVSRLTASCSPVRASVTNGLRRPAGEETCPPPP